MKTWISILIATVVIGISAKLGWWPVTVLAGIGLGLYGPRVGRTVFGALLAGALGWGLALLAASLSAEVVRTATVAGNILMLGGASTIVALLLPSIIGGLLALSGAWISGAAKAVVMQARPSLPSEHTTGV